MVEVDWAGGVEGRSLAIFADEERGRRLISMPTHVEDQLMDWKGYCERKKSLSQASSLDDSFCPDLEIDGDTTSAMHFHPSETSGQFKSNLFPRNCCCQRQSPRVQLMKTSWSKVPKFTLQLALATNILVHLRIPTPFRSRQKILQVQLVQHSNLPCMK